MSRSYKHTPRCGDKKYNKKTANRKLRRHRYEYLMQRSLYKRHFPQWDICDYETVGYSWDQFLKDYNDPHRYGFSEKEMSEKELRRLYNKWYINK